MHDEELRRRQWIEGDLQLNQFQRRLETAKRKARKLRERVRRRGPGIDSEASIKFEEAQSLIMHTFEQSAHLLEARTWNGKSKTSFRNLAISKDHWSSLNPLKRKILEHGCPSTGTSQFNLFQFWNSVKHTTPVILYKASADATDYSIGHPYVLTNSAISDILECLILYAEQWCDAVVRVYYPNRPVTDFQLLSQLLSRSIETLEALPVEESTIVEEQERETEKQAGGFAASVKAAISSIWDWVAARDYY
ncbi:hypothetical protein HKX48_008617 [Thoreauomyces humboldtii]|nr:hypothetical protein HKX48_008617 [Thoreauomyces humboldtii]